MQVIIDHDEIVEAIRQYMWRQYGMVVTTAYTTYPYKRGRPRDVETIWAVEAPLEKNQTRPVTQLRSALEAENSRMQGTLIPNPGATNSNEKTITEEDVRDSAALFGRKLRENEAAAMAPAPSS